MKFILCILVAVGVTSCGVPVEEQTADGQIGRDWALEADETFKTAEVNLLQKMCGSLNAKSTLFKNVYVGEGSILKYSLKSNDCSSDDLSSNGFATAEVVHSNSGLLLSSTSSGIISDILTNESSSIKTLCSLASSGAFDINTYKKTGDVVDFFKIGDSSAANCKAGSGEICFNIFTGYLDEKKKKYTIRDVNEYYIAISSTPSKNGLVTYRTKKSSNLCSDKEQFRTKVQVFESINI